MATQACMMVSGKRACAACTGSWSAGQVGSAAVSGPAHLNRSSSHTSSTLSCCMPASG